MKMCLAAIKYKSAGPLESFIGHGFIFVGVRFKIAFIQHQNAPGKDKNIDVAFDFLMFGVLRYVRLFTTNDRIFR